MSGPDYQPRLPMKPLEDMLESSAYQAKTRADANQNRVTNRDIGKAINRNPGSVQRWRSNGIPFFTADIIAVHLGLHPAYIWKREYWEAYADVYDLHAGADVAGTHSLDAGTEVQV